MAGQPQDPSWQSGAKDQARDAWQSDARDQAREAWQPVGQDQAQAREAREAREAWQQPSFTPQQGPPQPEPPQPGSPQDTFAFAQPPVYGQPPPQGQPAQGYPPPGQSAHGYPPPSYTAQDQSQGAPPQWSANQGIPRAAAAPRTRPRGENGFIGSLFDFNFDSMVTPKIIKAIYVLVAAWVGMWALILLIVFFKQYGTAAGLFALIIIDPIMILLGLGVTRVVLEFYMITFKIHEEVKAIRARGEEQG